MRVAPEVRSVALADGRTVHLYVMHALHAEEMALKLDRGTTALLAELGKRDFSEVLAVDRPPVTRKKLFGLF